MSRLKRKFLVDPLIWAAWLLVRHSMTKAKSAVLAMLFHAPGLYLGPRSLVRGARHIKFGRGVFAHGGLWLEAVTDYRDQSFNPTIELGDGVCFSEGVHISCIDRIVIKNNVLMGSRVHISDHNHGIYKGEFQSGVGEPPIWRKLGGGGPVEVGENVWIGDNVIILGPVKIGEGAIIGANSVVKKDVSPGAVVGGNPARAIRQFQPQSQTWEKV